MRIGKFLSLAGECSRRAGERLILSGRVSVNGELLGSVGYSVSVGDVVCVDGRRVEYRECYPRVWEYYKPRGCVVSERDDRGRVTVFDKIGDLGLCLPRLVSVGRLDYNSEGLLLLTNNGGLSRFLELPASGIERRYRVRVLGIPTGETLSMLRSGVVLDGVSYGAMGVDVCEGEDERGGVNCWLEVVLREGKNREIRRLFGSFGHGVSRLVRLSFGDFILSGLGVGELREVDSSILRERLGSMGYSG